MTQDGSKLTPEEILHKHTDGCDMLHSLTAIDAMTEYASQQTAALQARVKELEGQVEIWKANHGGMQDLSDLRASRIAELEGENEKLKQQFTGTYLRDLVKTDAWKEVENAHGISAETMVQNARLKQHAEKLMGLLETVFIENCERKYQEIFWWKNPERWQSYRKEHGI